MHESDELTENPHSLPTISYPDDLPVSARRAEIAQAIKDHQVVIVCGETGSGKTTQLPKICLELGRVDLQLSDSMADLVGENIDVAVRIVPVGGEGLVARPLQPYRMVIAAAPSYLRRRGHPRGVDDLARHDCLSYAVWQRRSEWILRGDGSGSVQWPEDARLRCNSGDGLRHAALRGLGLILQPEVLPAADMAAGRLVPVLQDCVPLPRPVHLVYLPDRRQLPKLAQFVGHMVRTLGAA